MIMTNRPEPFEITAMPLYSERRKVCNCDCYKSQLYEQLLKEAFDIINTYPTGQDDGSWIKRRQEFLDKGIQQTIESYGNPYTETL